MTWTGGRLLAHAYGERVDLPLPLYLFVIGGAFVVVLSFLLVLRRDSPTVAVAAEAASDEVPPTPFRLVPGSLSVLLVLLVAVVGLTGTQDRSANIAPLFFWVLVWIGLPFSCGLIGDWTRPWNAFANLGRLGNSASLRKTVLARTKPLEWSATLGWWPAVVLFVLLVLGELVFNLHTTQPGFVGGILVVYGILSFFLGLLFGASWLEHGEVFSGLFNAWGRLGYWRHGAPGRRGFAGGLVVPFRPSASRVVFVLLLLVSINFDGLLATPQWAGFECSAFSFDSANLDLFRTGSLIVLVLVVLAVFMAFANSSARLGGFSDGPVIDLARLLPSLVPIAYGYLIAHYLPYLVTQLQNFIPLTGNPGYTSWPIHLGGPFRQGAFSPNPTLLPNDFYWYLSVLVIIAVHVVAVVIAHGQLAGRAPDRARALRSEYPWLVAMVAYTAFSLFLIAQPLTQHGGSPTSANNVCGANGKLV